MAAPPPGIVGILSFSGKYWSTGHAQHHAEGSGCPRTTKRRGSYSYTTPPVPIPGDHTLRRLETSSEPPVPWKVRTAVERQPWILPGRCIRAPPGCTHFTRFLFGKGDCGNVKKAHRLGSLCFLFLLNTKAEAACTRCTKTKLKIKPHRTTEFSFWKQLSYT